MTTDPDLENRLRSYLARRAASRSPKRTESWRRAPSERPTSWRTTVVPTTVGIATAGLLAAILAISLINRNTPTGNRSGVNPVVASSPTAAPSPSDTTAPSPTASSTPSPSPSTSPTSSPSASPTTDGYLPCPSSSWQTTLTLDHSSYQAGQSVKMTAEVTNTSTGYCTAPSLYAFTIVAPDGTSATACWQAGIAAPGVFLGPGQSESQNCSWDSSEASSGSYSAAILFKDLQGTSETQSKPFTIQ